ncbi:unnamed protein product, partial [Ectocarpus sp. 12 AP-2014]
TFILFSQSPTTHPPTVVYGQTKSISSTEAAEASHGYCTNTAWRLDLNFVARFHKVWAYPTAIAMTLFVGAACTSFSSTILEKEQHFVSEEGRKLARVGSAHRRYGCV